MSLEENRTSGNPGAALLPITRLDAPSPRIALWWSSLEVTPAQLRICERYLSSAEHARASRFGDARLRNRYVVGRGSLRTVLGLALGVAPGAVDIVRGPRGRPQLGGTAPLDFNISHTGGVAIVGTVGPDARIGVDIERTDRVINVTGIARKFLSGNERSELANRDEDSARRRVLALWTCKEAMSKATGDALSAPFASIDIALDNRTVRGGPGVYVPAAWTLHAAAVPPDYVATVAVWHTP